MGAFEQVLRIDPQFHRTAAVVAYNIANGYAMSKEAQTARKFLTTALELDPRHQASLRLLSQLNQEK